ncbi:4-hydroxythreonine-4-phosphate dehydrogenase PdxA [Geomesophilobacter sediminis]|uniref:4-hydroxythreonine-4-phosphate dehydrogenase n=1 Tax=Geomesophilobacter sediminis TaxID=2798584 RepID=A0A8J7JJX4_9BACT|nr:4-hydroxythreonine-4-phosphate dehydrogenase PdxA [Geomesophilobacter sediminis]
MGDPSGVGPEIIAAALADPQVTSCCTPFVLGDLGAMQRGIAVSGTELRVEPIDAVPFTAPAAGVIPLRELSSLSPDQMAYGHPTPAGGNACFKYILEAARLCLEGKAHAMATAPINKESMNSAGHHYPGHTELLAEITGGHEVVMMLAGDKLRVTLVTIHEALADVPRLVTRERILSTIEITHRALTRWFAPAPRLAVLALNPHCGEGGMFGKEDKEIITPAVREARERGIDAVGPLSADTLFHFAARGDYDGVVCMYHDQGLIPLKLLHFDDGVNVTLGLPIIRTSVDHGTAYDLAGTGKASAASMKQAILMAAQMARRDAELKEQQ